MPPELDRFVHALISPLTAMHGTAGLIRRRCRSLDDQRVRELLAAMDRSADRLRQTCDLLLRSAQLRDDRIVIDLPAAAFQGDGGGRATPAPRQGARATPAPPAEPARAGGPALLIGQADGVMGELSQILARQGRQVVWAASALDGLDIARQQRLTVAVIDPTIDPRANQAIGIMAADPDTKMVPLVILGGGPAGEIKSREGALFLDPQLPSEAQAQVIAQVIAQGQAPQPSQRQILIVDDEAEIANLLALQFEDEGYATTQLRTGTEALRIARQQQFDLILLDLLLPDLDGLTVLGGLRARPETQLTPIILVSALNSPEEKVRGLQLGADDYITKPFSDAELSARVLAAMRRSEREGGANPSTRLPGNIAIERAIIRRIESEAPFVVCYCDLDNFKAYNDTYGFLKGDTLIQRTAQILLDAVREHGNSDDFVGHIGGDDFVIISTPNRVRQLCTSLIEQFDATAPLFYDREARERGYIDAIDRQGQPAHFALVTISVAVVSSEQRPFQHPGEVSERAVEPKKRTKRVPGSVFLIDE